MTPPRGREYRDARDAVVWAAAGFVLLAAVLGALLWTLSLTLFAGIYPAGAFDRWLAGICLLLFPCFGVAWQGWALWRALLELRRLAGAGAG